jgi:DNA polymerase-3 subunit chi
LRPASFLPHGLHGQEHLIRSASAGDRNQENHNDLLINLQLAIPPFFSRFQRVVEVVTQEPASLAALRESWKFYKERGYQLEKHDL